MPKIERRKHIRKYRRMPCLVQFSSGLVCYGNTSEVGLEGVFVELTGIPSGNNATIAIGDLGVLTLRYQNRALEDSIRLHCQVTQMTAHSMGLYLHFAELTKTELDILGRIIAAT